MGRPKTKGLEPRRKNMKFIGNFKDWIDPKVVEYLLANDGVARPNTPGKNPNIQEFIDAENVGYDLSKPWWYHYEKSIFPFDIKIPIETDKTVMWWFIKMKPGGMMPMHRDPHVTFDYVGNPKRYWLAMDDYVPGHVFVYNNIMLSDYKAGDLWMYTDPNELHGACNMSYKTRLSFLFTIYDTIK